MQRYSKEQRGELKEYGRCITEGALSFIAVAVIGILVVLCLLGAASAFVGVDLDNSDKNRFQRSGFKVWTDYGTGVQYLVTPQGHAVPRVNANGQTIIWVDDEK